ncbi:hypothetical protein ACLOJK_025997 [Asimina triloba]
MVVPEAGTNMLDSHDGGKNTSLQTKPLKFKNKFLMFVRLGSVVNDAAESFFKSEIRRRLFVTAALILASRVGYFIPLPGFDRRLIPGDYLSFVSGSVDELGDLSAELKLSLFQLGISPQIAASIVMQGSESTEARLILRHLPHFFDEVGSLDPLTRFGVEPVLCHVIPSLVKLRKEGLDGYEKIKGYIEAVYAGILTGYTNTLYKMLSQLSVNMCRLSVEFCSGSGMNCWPYIPAVLGIFTVVTMWAVLVTEGCRKIKLQYYAFKLASAARLELLSLLTALSEHNTYICLINANLPKEIADYMNKMGARIPGIKPGRPTVEYLAKIQASTRFWGNNSVAKELNE